MDHHISYATQTPMSESGRVTYFLPNNIALFFNQSCTASSILGFSPVKLVDFHLHILP